VKSIASVIVIAICIVVLAALTTPDLASANGYRWKDHRRHRIVWIETWSACEFGWWQTLRYGHVRPRGGMRCY
jgi:hypothetical protein